MCKDSMSSSMCHRGILTGLCEHCLKLYLMDIINLLSSDSMESTAVTMESPIPSVSSMASSIPSPPEMKPDITNLSSPPGNSGYSPSSSGGGPGGFFPHMQGNNLQHGPMSSQMSPSGPLQSPTLHSATSMHSPG